MFDPEFTKHLVEVYNSMPPMSMIAPVVLAALIGGGASLVGSLLNNSQQHEPGRIPDPYKDPVAARLAQYLGNRIGRPKPRYPGEINAEYNPALLAALQQITGNAQQTGAGVEQLLSQFLSPGGSVGWGPTNAAWRNRPSSAPSGGSNLSPEVLASIRKTIGG